VLTEEEKYFSPPTTIHTQLEALLKTHSVVAFATFANNVEYSAGSSADGRFWCYSPLLT
jgi:hypothetical protein